MNDNHDRVPDADVDPDALLDRHVDALRGEAVPDGPSAEALAATLAMLAGSTPTGSVPTDPTPDAADARPVQPRRRPRMTILKRLSLAASLAAAACLAWAAFALLGPLSPTEALAQVLDKVAAAKAVAYTMSAALPDGTTSPPIRTVAVDDGRVRTELPGGAVSIRDGSRVLQLDPAAKTATVVDVTGLPAAPEPAAPLDLLGSLRRMVGTDAQPAGDRTIGGVEASGLRAPYADGGTVTVWADKRTSDPLRIEVALPIGGRTVTAVLDHIELLDAVDPADFSTEVPDGYTLVEQKVDATTFGPDGTADAVAAVLRAYAAANGGAFPADLADWAALMSPGEDGTPAVGPQLIGAMSGRLFSTPGGYTYAGADARLGDAGRIVFWTRRPGTDAYLALFADLHAEDVAADRLPATRPAATP